MIQSHLTQKQAVIDLFTSSWHRPPVSLCLELRKFWSSTNPANPTQSLPCRIVTVDDWPLTRTHKTSQRLHFHPSSFQSSSDRTNHQTELGQPRPSLPSSPWRKSLTLNGLKTLNQKRWLDFSISPKGTSRIINASIKEGVFVKEHFKVLYRM